MMSLKSKRELLEVVQPRYLKASKLPPPLAVAFGDIVDMRV